MEKNLELFLQELTILSHKYNIAINGGEPYVMEYEDLQFQYAVNARGILVLA